MGTLGDLQGHEEAALYLLHAARRHQQRAACIYGNWKALLALYVLGTLGFNGSCVYYDSFLLDVTTEERMDRVSTLGYGLGYIGGSTIPLVLSPAADSARRRNRHRHHACHAHFLPADGGLVAGVHAPHAAPCPSKSTALTRSRNIVLHTLRNVKDTCCMILKNKSVVFFIIAYFFYIDGVGTIIHMATVFGDSCGLGSMDMMVVLLVVQIVAFPSLSFTANLRKGSAPER